MKITKVLIKGAEIDISWQEETAHGIDVYRFNSCDKANPRFYESISNLKKYLIEWCELNGINETRIVTTCIKIKYDNSMMYVSIVGANMLSNIKGLIKIETPKINITKLKNKNVTEHVNLIMKEASAYVAGEREQVGMFDEDIEKNK